MKKLILFLFFALSFSVEVRPISQMPFDLNSSDLVYGRGTYLIVLPNQSIESYITNENFGGDFVKFKKTQGFDVEFVYYDQVATNAQELKNHIMDYYSINPMLEYVLLVGDVNGPYTIPTFTINSYNEEDINVTDYPYTFQDDSYDAKFFLGRWTVRSVVDLINVKSRSIQYVKNDYVDKQIMKVSRQSNDPLKVVLLASMNIANDFFSEQGDHRKIIWTLFSVSQWYQSILQTKRQNIQTSEIQAETVTP